MGRNQEAVLDSLGSIISTTWNCHVFDGWEEFDSYLNSTKKPRLKTEKFTHYGNIFNCYDSYNYQSEFIPNEEENYLYLKHKSEIGSVAYIQDKLKKYYDLSMPEGYMIRTK